MNNAVTNKRLALLDSYYAEVDAEIARVTEWVTFYGPVENLHLEIKDVAVAFVAELAALQADRAELDRMWNETLLANEAA